MRTHLLITPTTAPALGDHMNFGIIVARSQDLGDPILAADLRLDPGQTDLNWAFWTTRTANPTFDPGGTNIVSIDLRSKRKCQELNETYVLSIKNNQAAATTYRVTCRTLLALP